MRGLVQHAVRAALVAAVVASCSASASPSAAPSSSGPPSPTPLEPTATTAPELVVGGDRPARVRLPASYDAGSPAPLVLLLHGYSSRGTEIDDYLGLGTAADELGVVTATPDGTIDSQGNQFWNATDACCNFDRRTVDDVAYLSEVIAEISEQVAIDPKRIAVVGHSNGGFMAHRMACERADLVSAIVSVAGATFEDPADCTPSDPVSVIQVHGTADDVIRYDGGGPVATGMQPYPGAPATAATWAANDGCRPTPSVLPEKLDVDTSLMDGADAAETTVSEWTGCDAGSAVQLWAVKGAGHVPSLTPAFADAVVRFLVEHPRP